MKNKTFQENKAPIIAYGFDFIKKETESLNPKDYKHLLKRPSKKEQQRYWSKTMLMLLIMVILIIYLTHFY